MATYNIADFGAVGDGETDNALAIQNAIDTCNAVGGGRVLVPAGGAFRAGPFELKSYVELHVQASASLVASTDETLYVETPFRNRSEGGMWIKAVDAERISITGTGTIDGQGTEFMVDEEPTHYNYKLEDGIDNRPHLLTLIGCRQVTIRDVTFANAAYWCIHPAGCQDVLIHGVRVLNSLKVRNCDGWRSTRQLSTQAASMIGVPVTPRASSPARRPVSTSTPRMISSCATARLSGASIVLPTTATPLKPTT